MKVSKKVLDLLKSGSFTIAYHDKDICTLHTGRMSYDKLPTKEFSGEFTNMVEEFIGWSAESYTPKIVGALVKALGGRVESI